MEKVTIYTTSEFLGNVVGRQGKLQELTIRKYAQYPNAVSVKYVPKRCRNTTGFVKTPSCGKSPYVLILKGHHPVDLDALNIELVKSTEAVTTVTKFKYRSFDEGYTNDFNKHIADYIEKTGAEVMFDTRTDDGFFNEVAKYVYGEKAMVDL